MVPAGSGGCVPVRPARLASTRRSCPRPKDERARRETERLARERPKAEERRHNREQAARDQARRQAVDAYLERLTPAERKALEAEALARADAGARQCYKEAPGRLRATVLLNLVREHVARELERGAIPAG